jgi:hypothetical protein
MASISLIKKYTIHTNTATARRINKYSFKLLLLLIYYPLYFVDIIIIAAIYCKCLDDVYSYQLKVRGEQCLYSGNGFLQLLDWWRF